MNQSNFLDEPPESDTITDYDRAHMQLYLRLSDAAADGADWREVMSVLFGLDPAADPARARRIYDTHLARVRWMAEHGYRVLAGLPPRK